MDSFSLFAACATVAFVAALAFYMAGRARDESFWSSWTLANVVLGMALLAFMYERSFPDLFVVTVPNGLLVLGMTLRWQAARQFAGRKVTVPMLWSPMAVFIVLCAWPSIYGSYGAVYTIVNVLLTVLALASAYEFWRDHDDGLRSRIGLVFAYGVLAISFFVRVWQGVVAGEEMARHLPDDVLLKVHLMVALFHLTATAAFALSLAYERDAASLRKLASHDPLTGLLNRGAFEAAVRKRLQQNTSDAFAILVLDIDHFKKINDRFGHAAGDEALRSCAKAIADVVDSKFPVARWGGEEFTVFLDDVSPAEVHRIAERIRRRVGHTVNECEGKQIRTTVSVGICHGSSGLASFDELMSAADWGLYRAKEGGRDRVEKVAA